MREALQTILEGEMTEFLGASPGERTDQRHMLERLNEEIKRRTLAVRIFPNA